MGTIITRRSTLMRGVSVAGVLLEAGIALLYGFAPSWWWLAGAAALDGIATTLVTPALSAGLTQYVPREHQAAYLVRVNAFASLGMLVTPLISAALFALWDIHQTFLILCVSLIVFSPLVLMIMPRQITNRELRPTTHSPAPTWVLMIIVAMATFAAGMFELIAPVALAQKLRFTPSDMGVYLFVLGMGFAIPQLGVQSWIRRLGVWSLVMGGMGMMAIGFLVLSFLSLGWALAVGGLLVSPFPGVLLAVGTYLAGDADDVAESFGWFEAANSLGYLVGALLGGVVFSTWGLRSTLLFGALVALMATLAWWKSPAKTELGRTYHIERGGGGDKN